MSPGENATLRIDGGRAWPKPLGILGLLALLALALPAAPASAQIPTAPCPLPPQPCITPPQIDPGRPRWQGHTLALASNAAIGGVAAGVVRAARGESFWAGFTRGAAGGGIVYLGKFIGTHDLPAIGLVGRQTAALGATITRSAMSGGGTFEHLTFPLGPIKIHRASAGTRLTIDLPTVVGTIYGLTRSGARFDPGRSLATGAVVFEVDSIHSRESGWLSLGRTIGGTIFHRPPPHYLVSTREIMAHELVHVIQHDFAMIAFSAPFESWLADRLPAPLARPLRHLDLGSHAALQALPGALGVNRRKTPWEREAYFLVPNK